MARGKKPGRGRQKERHKPADRAPGRRVGRPGVWAAAGAATALVLALARFDPYLFTGGDNAQYYALARALATGRGYVDLITPGAPPHTQYPPGFPALLVPFYLLSGGSYVALKVVSLIAAAAALVALYRLARRDSGVAPWAAAAVVWVVGLYGVFQLYAQRVLSDMTYLAFVLAALAVIQPVPAPRVDRRWILACGLALAAFYVRTAGVTLLAAIVVWALLRRRWQAAATAAAVFGAGVAPWFLWVRTASIPGASNVDLLTGRDTSVVSGTGGPVVEFVERIGDVFVEYGVYQFPQLFWPADPPPVAVRVVAVAAGGGLVVYGAWRLLRSRGVAPWDLYVGATLAILPFWPWLGDRYMLTIAPFLWLYLLAGLDDVAGRSRSGPALAARAVGAFAAILIVVGLVAAGRQWDRTRAWLDGDEFAGYAPFWADYFRAAQWIGDSTSADAVVLARKPTLVWYWSGRSAVPPPRRTREELQWQRIRESRVTHILLEPATEDELSDVLHPNRDLFRVVHQTPRGEVVVLRVAPEAIAEPTTP